MSVEVVWEDINEDFSLPKFQPASSEAPPQIPILSGRKCPSA
jgi:hypothetical protein